MRRLFLGDVGLKAIIENASAYANRGTWRSTTRKGRDRKAKQSIIIKAIAVGASTSA